MIYLFERAIREIVFLRPFDPLLKTKKTIADAIVFFLVEMRGNDFVFLCLLDFRQSLLIFYRLAAHWAENNPPDCFLYARSIPF